MRQIVNSSSCQIWRIADDSTFNGTLEEESGFFSDASLYENDPIEDEFFDTSLIRDNQDVEVDSNKKSLEVDVRNDNMGSTFSSAKSIGGFDLDGELPFQVELVRAGTETVLTPSGLDTIGGSNQRRVTRGRPAKYAKKSGNALNVFSRKGCITTAKHKQTGKQDAVTGFRSAGQEISKDDSFSSEQFEISEFQARDGKKLQSKNKKSEERCKSGASISLRKQISETKGRFDMVREGEPDLRADLGASYSQKHMFHRREQHAEFEAGASISLFASESSRDRHADMVRKAEEYLELETIKDLCKSSREGTESRGEVDRQIATGRNQPPSDNLLKRKRGRPRKERPKEGVLGDEKLVMDKNDNKNIVGLLDSFPIEEMQDAATENCLHSNQRKAKQCTSSVDVGAGGNHDKYVTGLEESQTFSISSSHQNSVIRKVGSTCRGLLDLKLSEDLHVDSSHSPAVDNGSGKKVTGKGLLKGEPHSVSKKQGGSKYAMANDIDPFIQRVKQVSGPEEAKALKSRKGRPKQVNKSGDGENNRNNEVSFEKETVKEEAIPKHRRMSVKVGRDGRSARAVKEEDEQPMYKGRYKGKRKLVKGPAAQIELEEQGECPFSATSEAGKISNNVQSKRRKVGSEGSNTDNQQRRKRRPVTTEIEELVTEKCCEDKAVATELTTSSKKLSFGGGQKGQKKSDYLLKERKEILPCEDGNAPVGVDSAGSTEGGMSNPHLTAEDHTNAARGQFSASEVVRSGTGVAKQEKQPDSNFFRRLKHTSCKGNDKHCSNAEASSSQVGPVKEFCASLGSLQSIVEHQAMAGGKEVDNGVAAEEVSSCVTEGGDGKKRHSVCEKRDDSNDAELGTLNVGWVLCDDCHKWRCIPAKLADVIEATNCRWCCRDNPSKDFADCSIPQEKSNAEINAELNISEVSIYEEGDDNNPPVDSDDCRQAVWTLIKNNAFLHRQRKVQTIDEIMVCQCKLSEDGGIGCGDECLNRMLSIECVPETCPCSEFCSNQQFQKRAYTRVGWYRCGKKGFGLQVLEDVHKGSFIIEYIGEVLDRLTYEARQKEYACRGQKHFYFMTLNSDEVIDACAKGNLGRFINHSCEPNCVTEKWMVNGEVCIGLFAIRDLAKGEEITFDYNYVRVCGAVAKKCHCGSSMCRGFIGGDPTTPLVVVESESDGEDPEPLMVEEPEEQVEPLVEYRRVPTEAKHVEERSLVHVSTLKRKWVATETPQNVSKRVKIMSSLRKSGVMKGLTIETSGGRFEGVEEKLNELLDENGGIGRRKDASMHYLKLLVMTAASGDTINGEASRRTRDLSMVLDALLKTLHRSVLADIVSKNGLQILHNMMKQNRRNYKKTPIIRKLLKVLEFLAARNILTFEQLNSNPPRNGIESIRDTLVELSRHSDGEIQQIAWRFREKWLPRKLRKGYRGASIGPISENAQNNSEKSFLRYQQKSNWSYPRPHMVPDQGNKERKDEAIKVQNVTPTADDNLAKKARRMSRWDQPSKPSKAEGQVSGVSFAGAPMDNSAPWFTSKSQQGQSADVNKHYGSYNGHSFDGQHKTAAASSDRLSVHLGVPEAPSLPQPVVKQTIPAGSDSQSASSSSHLPSVVSGVPVEQFLGASPAAIIPQPISICYGIPVAIGKQFNGSQNLGPNVPPSLQPSRKIDSLQGSTSNRTPVEQQQQKSLIQDTSLGHNVESKNVIFGVPHTQFFQHKDSRKIDSLQGLTSNRTPVEQQQQKSLIQDASLGHSVESKNVIFGVPHTQFFQQMQSIFGPAFHPWHVRVLMAPHSWGPYFTIDPELIFEGTEPGLEPEPPVPGLSPPHNIEHHGSQLERSRNLDRVEAAGQPPEAPGYRLSTWEGSAGQLTESSKWRSSRWEGSAGQPTDASNWRSSRWEDSANQPNESSNWKSSRWEGLHGPQDGSTEASNGRFSDWEGSNGPRSWKFHGRKYNNSMYRRGHSFPRRYNRPTYPWRGDFNKFHASSDAAQQGNFSYKNHAEKVVRASSRETKWDVMPRSGRCNIGFVDPSCSARPSRSDRGVPQVDIPDSETGFWPRNKLGHNMSDVKEDQLTHKGYSHEGTAQLQKNDNQDSNTRSFTNAAGVVISRTREAINLRPSDGNFGRCAEQVQPLQEVKRRSIEQCEMVPLPPCKVSHTNQVQNSQEKAGICRDSGEHYQEYTHQSLNNEVTCLGNWHKEELEGFWSEDLPQEAELRPYGNVTGQEEHSCHPPVNNNLTKGSEQKCLESSTNPRADCKKLNRKMMDKDHQDPLDVAKGEKGINGKDSLDRLEADNFMPKYCEEEWVKNSPFADPVAHCLNLSYAEVMDRTNQDEFDVAKDSICDFEISNFDEGETIHDSVVDVAPQDDVAVMVNAASHSARWISTKDKTANDLSSANEAPHRVDNRTVDAKEETLGSCPNELPQESQTLSACIDYNTWRDCHDNPVKEDMDSFLASDEEGPQQMHIDGFGFRNAGIQEN